MDKKFPLFWTWGVLLLFFLKVALVQCQLTIEEPYCCDFEVNQCGFEMDAEDPNDSNPLEWLRIKGTSPSRNTGPPDSYQGYMMYMEASHHNTGETRALVSPPVKPRSADSCLTFSYNVNGIHIGAMHILASSERTPFPVTIWSYTGSYNKNKDNVQWHTAMVTLPSWVTQFEFEAVRGGSGGSSQPYGDICLDMVCLNPEACLREDSYAVEQTVASVQLDQPQFQANNIGVGLGQNGFPQKVVLEKPNQVPPVGMGFGQIQNGFPQNVALEKPAAFGQIQNAYVGHAQIDSGWCCDFEANMCGFEDKPCGNPDPPDWKRIFGTTPSHLTGPLDFLHGFFIYFEATGHNTGEVSCIQSQPLAPRSTDSCLKFAYNVHGMHMGNLHVITYTGEVLSTIWSYQGSYDRNKDNTAWHTGTVTLPVSAQSFGFKGERGGQNTIHQPYGDICLDDICVTQGPCPQDDMYAANQDVAQLNQGPKFQANNVQVQYHPNQEAYVGQPLINPGWCCDFEQGMCGFEEKTLDANPDPPRWIREYNTTPSEFTGPLLSDPSNLHGYMVYMEATGHDTGEVSALQSQPLAPRSMDSCLTFHYNVHGMHMGNLHVVIFTGNNVDVLWSYHGSYDRNIHDIPWHTGMVTIPSSADSFGFKGERGGQNTIHQPYGDICLDDICVSEGPCPSGDDHLVNEISQDAVVQDIQGVINNNNQNIPVGNVILMDECCDFEGGECGYEMEAPGPQPPNKKDDLPLLWIHYPGVTPSKNTGPLDASQGYIMCMEATDHVNGEVSTLRSRNIVRRSSDSCLHFKYNVNGWHAGDLHILAYQGTAETTLWSYYGSDKDKDNTAWHAGAVTLPTAATNIGFKAVRGGTSINEPYGDVCIDDICINEGSCTVPDDHTASGPEIQPLVNPLTYIPSLAEGWCCDFEMGWCGFNEEPPEPAPQDKEDTAPLEWKRGDFTPSSRTGPVDKTQKYFAFMEATNHVTGESRVIKSLGVSPAAGSLCLIFKYNVHGMHMGDLHVISFHGPQGKDRRIIWSYLGDYDVDKDNTPWHKGNVSLPGDTTHVGYKAVRGGMGGMHQPYGDISVDDVCVVKGPCEPEDPHSIYRTQDPLSPLKNPSEITAGFCCDFEQDECGLTMQPPEPAPSDKEDNKPLLWIRYFEFTPSRRTGPVTGEQGYMYCMEATDHVTGESRTIKSKALAARSVDSCLQFQYNVHGMHMGDLHVLSYTGATSQVQWSYIGNYDYDINNTAWHNGSVTISKDATEFGFRTVRGGKGGMHQPYGDICLDDICLKEGPCTTLDDNAIGVGTWPSTNDPPAQVTPIVSDVCPEAVEVQHCTFTGDNVLTEKCSFYNSNNKYWYLYSFQIANNVGAGSSVDVNRGQFLYLKSDRSPPGTAAELTSPSLWSTAGAFCLRFAYHMAGEECGELYVTVEDGSDMRSVFSIVGNQGVAWQYKRLDLPAGIRRTSIGYKDHVYSAECDIALDDVILFSGTCQGIITCEIPTFANNTEPVIPITSVYCCYFEEDICGFQMQPPETAPPEKEDNKPLLWIRYFEFTPSRNTGPVTGEQGHMYCMEATDHVTGESRSIKSVALAPRSVDSCLKFKYNVHGMHIGDLHVLAFNGADSEILWSYIGSYDIDIHNTAWHNGSVTISKDATEFGFRAVRGGKGGMHQPYGDICLDDICLTEGPCSKGDGPCPPEEIVCSTWPPTNDPATPVIPIVSDVCPDAVEIQHCTFTGDNVLTERCSFYNSNDKYWYLYSFQIANNVGVGTSDDANPGQFLYLKADRSVPGTLAGLTSPDLTGVGGAFCLRFAYHMSGDECGELYVAMVDRAAGARRIYQIAGDQGTAWQYQRLDLPEGTWRTMIGYTDSVYAAECDIALDDIILFAGTCQGITNCDLPTYKNATDPVFYCSFEPDQITVTSLPCNMTVPGDGVFKWVLYSGLTPSLDTGPTYDYTLRNPQGHYMYTEVSEFVGGVEATFCTARFPPNPSGASYCVTFWYNLNGAQMGRLALEVRTVSGETGTLVDYEGQLNDVWRRAQLIAPPETAYLCFYGNKRRGLGPEDHTGDMAVDDLLVIKGPCDDDQQVPDPDRSPPPTQPPVIEPPTPVGTNPGPPNPGPPTGDSSGLPPTLPDPWPSGRPGEPPTEVEPPVVVDPGKVVDPELIWPSGRPGDVTNPPPLVPILNPWPIRKDNNPDNTLQQNQVSPDPPFPQCPIILLLQYCNFDGQTELTESCKFYSSDTEFPWYHHKRPLALTGYLFFDPSFMVQGQRAVLKSPDLSLFEAPYCLSFWYRHQGADNGLDIPALAVYRQLAQGQPTKIWEDFGNMYLRDWVKNTVNINQDTTRILIAGTKVASDVSIVIDDVVLQYGSCTLIDTCQLPVPTPSPIPTVTEPPLDISTGFEKCENKGKLIFMCDFEIASSEICSEQTDANTFSHWQRKNDPAPPFIIINNNVGPSGYYFFMDSQDPSDNRAILATASLREQPGPKTLSFWYYFFDSTDGYVSVCELYGDDLLEIVQLVPEAESANNDWKIVTTPVSTWAERVLFKSFLVPETGSGMYGFGIDLLTVNTSCTENDVLVQEQQQCPTYVCDNSLCEQICRKRSDTEYYCECIPGYDLVETYHCADVDECARNPSPCDVTQTCCNVIGSYVCLNLVIPGKCPKFT